jgi:ABC-type dipeptide/oligopeptide/nickel transport system permease component
MKALSRGMMFTGNFVVLGGILQGLHNTQWIAGCSMVLWIVIGFVVIIMGGLLLACEK